MLPPLAITAAHLLTPLDTPNSTSPLTTQALKLSPQSSVLSPFSPTFSAILSNRRVTNPAIPDALLDPDSSLDRSLRIALTVARRALQNTDTKNLHLFTATSKGPVSSILQALDLLRQGHPIPPILAQQITLGPAALGTFLANRLQLPLAPTSVAACASGLHALHAAAQALWRGTCTRALVVAADASLHPLFQASFQRLGVLAPPPAPYSFGIRHCEPFHPDGRGFFLAEAGAALLLELPNHFQNHINCAQLGTNDAQIGAQIGANGAQIGANGEQIGTHFTAWNNLSSAANGAQTVPNCAQFVPNHAPTNAPFEPPEIPHAQKSSPNSKIEIRNSKINYPLALLEQTWIGADSTDLIAIDQSTDSLRRGIAACLPTNEIPAFVHAHATGTAHDAYELAAIRAIMGGGGNSPEVFSHKAFLGHSLGAAGLVSIVLSALCHAHRTTLRGTPLPPHASSLTIAQGFGGHIALARLRGI